MRSIRIATILAALTVGAATLSAQSTTPAPTGTTTTGRRASPARDSLRAIRQNSKALMADRKAAKASGDTQRMKADSKALRDNHRQAQKLSKGLPRRRHAPRKTPLPPKP